MLRSLFVWGAWAITAGWARGGGEEDKEAISCTSTCHTLVRPENVHRGVVILTNVHMHSINFNRNMCAVFYVLRDRQSVRQLNGSGDVLRACCIWL